MKTPLLTLMLAASTFMGKAQNNDVIVHETVDSPLQNHGNGSMPLSFTYRPPHLAATNFTEADTVGWDGSCKRTGHQLRAGYGIGGLSSTVSTLIEVPVHTRDGVFFEFNAGVEHTHQRRDIEKRDYPDAFQGGARILETDWQKTYTPTLRASVVVELPLLQYDNDAMSGALLLRSECGAYAIPGMQPQRDITTNLTTSDIQDNSPERLKAVNMFAVSSLVFSVRTGPGQRGTGLSAGVSMYTVSGVDPYTRIVPSLSLVTEFGGPK